MGNVVLEWNEVLLEAIRTTKPGPPMAARSLGVVYTGIYDAWAAYSPIADPVHSTVSRRPSAQRTTANIEAAINQVAYRLLLDQFPAVKGMLDAKLTALGGNPSDNNANPGTGVGVGNLVANAVIAFRHNDNSNQQNNYADTTGYVPRNQPIGLATATTFDQIADPERWQPLSYTNPATGQQVAPSFIAPHWGLVKPFALSSGSEFRPTPPQSLLSQGFLEQAKHVVDVQANLTPKQKVIAEYWADGPRSELPPGHWALFTAFVVNRDSLGLDDTVKLFFAVANAIFDASIATWEAKRFYDYVRPITAIRYLFRGKTIKAWGGPGQGTVSLQGEAWRTFQSEVFPTPPFPEYTSGHSAFSMAAATALKRYLGSDKFEFEHIQNNPLIADPTENVAGISLKWSTFTEAAWEAGESRLYGGIHFYEGNVAGLDLGKKVGNKAFEKAESYWKGTIS